MIVFFLVTSLMALLPLAFIGMVSGQMLVASLCGFPAVWFGSWLGAVLYQGSSEGAVSRRRFGAAGGDGGAGGRPCRPRFHSLGR